MRIDREMRLSFNFIWLEPDAEGYTVIISERDAETLGSATESSVWVDGSVRNQKQAFTASKYIDEFDFDDVEPDAPCLQDAIMLRDPSGAVSELHPAGECLGPSWFVDEIEVGRPADS